MTQYIFIQLYGYSESTSIELFSSYTYGDLISLIALFVTLVELNSAVYINHSENGLSIKNLYNSLCCFAFM